MHASSVRFVVLSLILAVGTPNAAPAEHSDDPSQPDTTCTAGETVELEVELGPPAGFARPGRLTGIPLPRTYGNPSGSDVTFVGTMRANALFGPEREVFRREVPAGLGISFSENPVVATDPTTPVTTDRVIVDFTTTGTGDTIVARCDYLVTVVLPEELANLIQVPVRWCALEGSPEAGGTAAGDTIDGAVSPPSSSAARIRGFAMPASCSGRPSRRTVSRSSRIQSSPVGRPIGSVTSTSRPPSS